MTFFGLVHCGETVQETTKVPSDKMFKKGELDFPNSFKADHLAKISFKDRTFILHGLFTKNKAHFKLNAFGDFDTFLFTVTYSGNRMKANIHFSPLKKKKFNAIHVGEDLWRIYYAKSNKSIRLFRKKNRDFPDRKVKLKYNKNNVLTHKLFYIGKQLSYRIQYKDYHDYNGIILAKVIICENLKYKYKLKIVTLKASR